MGTGKIIFIRADANEYIASGHIMRCLTIAQVLRELGNMVTFLVSDQDSVSMLVSRNESNVICMHSNFKQLENELPSLIPILKDNHVDILLLDSYTASKYYMESIRDICKLVYIDDLQAFDYPADLIINYDLEVNASFYKNKLTLLGAAYTPLRKQFQSVPYEVNKKVCSILITTGGSDTYQAATKILKAMNNYDFYKQSHLSIHVLIGKMNRDKSELKNMVKNDTRIYLHENISDMADLLMSCDLAFSAGGTTLFELCAIGVPSISFSVSDEQAACVYAFDRKKMIPYAGDVREGITFFQRLLEMGIKIAEDYETRKKTSANMRKLLDGKGSIRIAKAITDLSQ